MPASGTPASAPAHSPEWGVWLADLGFLPAQADQLERSIPGARREVITSLHGHDGFLIEAEQMDAILRDFLAGA